jgi:hypothetical protein
MKRLYLTLRDSDKNEIFSDFIANIDAVDSHTVVYQKQKYSEADVIRMPFHLNFIAIKDGIVYLYYDNGVHAEIIRK